MKHRSHLIKTNVWVSEAAVPVHFVSIQGSRAEEIKKEDTVVRPGFGNIPVMVTLGQTSWKTSLFPNKKGGFDIPVKKAVLDAEGVKAGEEIEFGVRIVG